jgi:hypothetical protein
MASPRRGDPDRFRELLLRSAVSKHGFSVPSNAIRTLRDVGQIQLSNGASTPLVQ